MRVLLLLNARRGPQCRTAPGPESSIPPTGRCRSSASRGKAETGSRGSRLCDRGPPSSESGACGTRAEPLLARAILMASTPLASHFVRYLRLRSYRLPTPDNRAPVEPYRVLLLLWSPLCERETGTTGPGVLKHVHTVEPSCSPPAYPVVKPCISVATTENIPGRKVYVYCGRCRFSVLVETGSPLVRPARVAEPSRVRPVSCARSTKGSAVRDPLGFAGGGDRNTSGEQLVQTFVTTPSGIDGTAMAEGYRSGSSLEDEIC